MGRRAGVVVLSTADWDAATWTNKQHTARALRDAGLEVFYVESMGLRPPRLSAGDGARIARRFRRLLQRPDRVEPGITRWSPPSVPLQRFALVRWLNRVVVSALLRFWSRRAFGGEAAICWTYNPMTPSLVDVPAGTTLVYHCVDDVAAQPDMPVEVIRRDERALVGRADHVFVTSRELEARWSRLRPVRYDPNCVDLARFTAPVPDDDPLLAHIPHPRIGFVGTLAAYKVDAELLLELSEAEPGCSIVLIGPRADGHPTMTAVLARPNVHHVGAQPYGRLPALMHTFAVGIIPACTGEYAQMMFPMKFFEYLAAGIPVVSTNLPALQDFTSVAAIVDREQFVKAVRVALDGDVPDPGARRQVCEENTYSARTDRMLAAIADSRDPG